MTISKITTSFVELSLQEKMPYFGQLVLHNKKIVGKIFEINNKTCKFVPNSSLKLNSQLELGSLEVSGLEVFGSVEYNHILNFNHIFFANLYPIPRGSVVYFSNLEFATNQLKESYINFVTKLPKSLKDEILLILRGDFSFEEIRKYQDLAGNYQEYSLTIFTDCPKFSTVASFDGFKMQNYHLENWLQKNMSQPFRNIVLSPNCIQDLVKQAIQNPSDLHSFAKLELIHSKVQELVIYVKPEKLESILSNQTDLNQIISQLEILTII